MATENNICQSTLSCNQDCRKLLQEKLNCEIIINGLNPEQKAAVIDESQIINVNAGPGTGKTHLLVRKFLFYLCGHADRNIVALSFTNTAANQLKERILELLFMMCGDNIDPKNCVASTIHSYCYTLLARYYESVGEKFDYEILDDSVIDDVATDIAEQYHCESSKSDIKRALENKNEYVPSSIASIVKEYKDVHHFIRVDEILTLFMKDCQTQMMAQWLKGKVDCLLVDESQDLGKDVYEIINVLYCCNPNLRLFFVGDPRQNIFGFNGGSYQNFKRFITRLNTHVSEHNLVTSYRCPVSVTNLANKLTFTDCPNPGLIAHNSTTNGEFKIFSAPNDRMEASNIVDLIMRANDNAETCVLCTSLKHLESVASQLNVWKIPFVVKGGTTVMVSSIKIINHCLRIIENDNTNSWRVLLREIAKRCGAKTISKKDLEIKLHSFRATEDNDLFDLSVTIVELKKWLQELYLISEEDSDLLETYEGLSKEYLTIPEFLYACSAKKNDEFAECYRKVFNVECSTQFTDDKQPVTLSTIHSAKGLEWKNVILAGMQDGMLPNYRCDQENDISVAKVMLNDEMKKYYVAITRSKQNLYLTYVSEFVSKYGRRYPRYLCRFAR